jgi:nucleotide-binding universal stress UspA family protein
MFEKVVVAVDGSESADRAVMVAAELAEAQNGEIVVVHVAPLVVVGWAVAIEAENPEEASGLADEAVRTMKDRGISARPEVRTAARGLIAREILAVAEAEGAGVIVMGSRGLGDVTGLLLGSITHRVLHLAHIPVLVVR